jgi:hypothetical protein
MIGVEIKNKDWVMLDEVFGVRTLAVIIVKPNLLTGPQREAH